MTKSIDSSKFVPPPDEGKAIDEALARAVRAALIDHKHAGNPVAVWRDGRVVWIQPEDIPVEESIVRHGS